MKIFLVGASGGMGRTFLSMQDQIEIVAGLASKEGEIEDVKYKGMRRIRKTRLCNRNAIKQRVTEHNVKSIMY